MQKHWLGTGGGGAKVGTHIMSKLKTNVQKYIE